MKIQSLLTLLEREYPNPKAPLRFSTPFESLIATILSAQCTDERVNQVTPALFKAAHTPEEMLLLGQKKLISLIHSTGFFNAKAKNIRAACSMLIEKYNGKVPGSLEELQTLPGVGRKTASVVLCQSFGIPAFPVDRHVFRVAERLGIANGKNPTEIDLQLRTLIPKNKWTACHLQLIFLGRSYCRPKPKCTICPFRTMCKYGSKKEA